MRTAWSSTPCVCVELLRPCYRGVVAFRPAIVNWRTEEADVDLRVDIVRELGARLGAAAAV